MQIGFVGLGKLGLPSAAAMSVALNKPIYGFDIDNNIRSYIKNKATPYYEKDLNAYLEKSQIIFVNSIKDVVVNSDTVFVAVQTPHQERFEGITPVPDDRSDFEYSYLIEALKEIDLAISEINKKVNVVVISTVLPGTFEKKLVPVFKSLKSKYSLIYNPYFIAMGTTIDDFLNPEFVLIGGDSSETHEIANLYRSFINANVLEMSISSAEIVKVSYNTFIGLKITFANSIAEIASKTGGNADEVMSALFQANKRLISTAYLNPGMGDGGGCHPRDQIAMSWLAKEYNLSFDIFEYVAKARDKQTEYLADIIADWHFNRTDRQEVVILGESYKKNIGLTVGSPSKLLQYFLNKKRVNFRVVDPFVNNEDVSFDSPKIFFVATPHDVFKNFPVPIHSVVLDPWGDTLERQYGVRFVNIGRREWP